MRISEIRAKGYFEEDFKDAFKTYIPSSEVEALKAELSDTPELVIANQPPIRLPGSPCL